MIDESEGETMLMSCDDVGINHLKKHPQVTLSDIEANPTSSNDAKMVPQFFGNLRTPTWLLVQSPTLSMVEETSGKTKQWNSTVKYSKCMINLFHLMVGIAMCSKFECKVSTAQHCNDYFCFLSIETNLLPRFKLLAQRFQSGWAARASI